MHKEAISAELLCRRLLEGWSEDHPEAAREFVARLGAAWRVEAVHAFTNHSSYCVTMELVEVRLQGASTFGCLVLGGDVDAVREMTAFGQCCGGAGRTGLVLAATPALAEQARQAMTTPRCAFLGGGEIVDLLVHPRPLELLKQHLRAQIPRLALLPYDIIHTPKSNMFFGRRDVLDRLHYEDTTSFAIAGPGRIGKSSILKQYVVEQRWQRGSHLRPRLYIDCFDYATLDADSFAQRIALDCAAHVRANRVSQTSLKYFLKWLSHDGRHPLELLLDEVDLVCRNRAFEVLGEAVKLGYCRLILGGKGILHAMMRARDTQLAARLELIQPEPLDQKSAERLLFEPLNDAGFAIEEREELEKEVFEFTRLMPQLLQACAKKLAVIALSHGTNTITRAHLREAREKSDPAFFNALPLDSLQDDMTRLVALLLVRSGCGVVTVGRLQHLTAKEGVTLAAQKALDICYDLWICNVLTWSREVFALSNPMLVDFMHKLGILPGEIARLLNLVRTARSGSAS